MSTLIPQKTFEKLLCITVYKIYFYIHNIKDMKLQTKWKVGTVYWKLPNGQETKDGSKKLKGD